MNKELTSIEISLLINEIKFLKNLTGLGIKDLWSKEDRIMTDSLNKFFSELLEEVDNE
jgi:hypothetical protein